MIRRFLAFVVVAALLVSAIVYSQYVPAPDKVSGFLEADEIRVGSRVGGRVAVVHVQEGERVAKDQVLVELEPFDLMERKNEAVATLAARQAEVHRLENGFRPEEIRQAKAHYEQIQAEHKKLVEGPREQEIEVARAQLRVAHARQELTKKSYDRVNRLVDNRAASKEELDQARESLEAAGDMVSLREQELDLLLVGTREEDLESAMAQVEEARAAWDLKQEGYRREDVAAAKAARDAAQFALLAIDRQLDELKIHSPLDGVIEAFDLEPGDLVPPSAPVLSLLDDNHIWVRAYIPQNRLSVNVGQKLRISIDSFGEEDFEGTVIFVSRLAEFTPSNVQTPEERSKLVFRMKVAVQNPEKKLRPGMSADVWLPETESGP